MADLPLRPQDPFKHADAVVRILSGLLGIVFVAYIIYLWFFRH
jgi:hypothetical protein